MDFLQGILVLFSMIPLYIVYVIATFKLRCFLLERQVPFVKPDPNLSWIKSFFVGNTIQLNQYRDCRVLLKWREDTKSDIIGYKLGFMPALMIFDQELISLIATSRYTADFHKTNFVRLFVSFLGTGGIFLQEDEAHLFSRNALTPAFTMDNIKAMFPVFTKIANELCRKLEKVDPVEFKIAKDLHRCSLDIISEVAFNYNMDSLKKDCTISDAFQTLLVKSKLSFSFLFQLSFPLFRYLSEPFNKNKDLKIVKKCIDDVILNRIKEDTSKNDDLLSKCIQAVRNEPDEKMLFWIRDQVLSFMFAGHETTSSALAWSLYALGQNSKVQNKLFAEVAALPANPTFENIQSMGYLDNFVNEILRLYSPIVAIARQSTKSFTFKNKTFPSGTSFVFPLQAYHLDPANFNNPDEFEPDRWDEIKLNKHSFSPFWMGIRSCIGKNLAIVEIKAILVVLVQHFEFSGPPTKRELLFSQKPETLKINLTHRLKKY